MSSFPWIAWYIWKARNEKIFNDKDISSLDSLQNAVKETESWTLAQRVTEEPVRDSDQQQQQQQRLLTRTVQPTRTSRWKCQTDASWINAQERAGLGFVLIEAEVLIMFGARGTRGVTSPLHAESEGLICAMRELLKTEHREVSFESDCEQLIKLIEKEEDWPAMAPEIDEIKALSAEFTEFSISYIPRSMNVRADSLAKGGRSRVFGSPFVNYFAPSWLAYAGQGAAN